MLKQLIASAAVMIGMAASATTLDMGEQFGTENMDEIPAWTQGGFTFIPSVGLNTKNKVPCYKSKNKEVRLYALNTLTVKAPENVRIKSITFSLSKQGVEEQAVITVDTGNIADQTAGDKAVTWSGEAGEIIFTVGATNSLHPEGIADGSGQFDFTSIEIESETDGSTSTDIIFSDSNDEKIYYDLNGRQVINPFRGTYICRQGESVKKVIIR